MHSLLSQSSHCNLKNLEVANIIFIELGQYIFFEVGISHGNYMWFVSEQMCRKVNVCIAKPSGVFFSKDFSDVIISCGFTMEALDLCLSVNIWN